MRKPFKKSLNQIPLEQAHEGSGSRQLIFSKDDAVSKYFEAMTKGYLKSGNKFDWHSHQNIDEFFLVTKGNGVIEFKDSDSLEYKEGDLIYIPANIEHRIIASEKVDNEFFFIRLQGE
jgi:mannose-6-phosphate isomerase-like protein (cupin superfamily)